MNTFSRVLLTGLLPLAAISCTLIGNEPTEFTLSGQPSVQVNAASQSVEVSFKCDKMWEASMKGGIWASVAKESLADDNLTASISVALSYNPSEEARKDTLVLTSGSKQLMTEIVQLGRSSYLSSVLLSLDKEASLTINSIFPWEINVKEGRWFSFDPSSGQAGSAVVYFKAIQTEDGLESHSGTVVFTSGKDKIEISLVKGQTDAIMVTPMEVELPCIEGVFTLKAEHNVGFDVQTSESWLSVNGTKSLEESIIRIAYQENASDRERTASVVIKSKEDASLVQTVSVTQRGKDPILDESAWGIYYSGTAEPFLYEKGVHQIGRTYSEGLVGFRIMDVANSSVTEITGFSDDVREGESVTLTVKNGKSSKTFESMLLRVEGDIAWLRATDGTGFIIKI